MEKILKKLISFRTLSDNFETQREALNWIKKEIENLPLWIKEEKSKNWSSLLITTQKTKRPFLWLQAHLDVVPGPSFLFRPKIKKGKLYGRGAFDMKFAIACYLKILKDLSKDLQKYNFGIMITTDEEIGGENGVKFLLEKGYLSKVCFLPDGGENWKAQLWAKGAIFFKIEAFGKPSHGSRPWKGENAIEKLILFLQELKKHFPPEPCQDKNHLHNTLNIGKFEGGAIVNKVPEKATAFIDIRFLPKIKKKEIKKLLLKVKRELKMKNLSFKEITFAESFGIESSNEYLNFFFEIAKEKFGIKKSFTISHGSSDGRFFAQKDIPVLMIRPKGGGAHSNQEWIDVKDLPRYCEVLKEFVKGVSKKS